MSVEVFSSLEEARNRFGPAALAIGNFDGLHVGHRALIQEMSAYAEGHDLQKGVLTFHPHPTVLVAPDRVPPMICTLHERIAGLKALGVERILVLPFTPELSRYTPERFVREVLIDDLQTRATFVGANFHFGYRQAGTPAVLIELGKRLQFDTTFVEPIKFKGQIISSSAIRQALLSHRLHFASKLTGSCFCVTGSVVSGQGIGRRETVPTLNILPAPEQLLLRGVFVTRIIDVDSKQMWPSITNVGVRPTFQGEGVTIESYLLAELGGQTPQTIRVEFRRFIREERQFQSVQELKQQILHDVARAQSYWRRVMAWTPQPLSVR